MTAPSPEVFMLEDAANATVFEAIRRNFQDAIETRYDGAETIFTTIGEYAIQQPPAERWQLTPSGQWQAAQDRHSNRPVYRQDWATAEELRTRAGEGAFEPHHMDALDEALVRKHRVTNASTKLSIATEGELQEVLRDHRVPLDQWRPTGVHDLYMYVRPSNQPETDDISLHEVTGELWLASRQTMLADVYYTDTDGATHRLQETEKRHYDNEGRLGERAKLTMHSSLGETGLLIDGVPEPPFDAAVRCMKEEIGADYNEGDVLQVISTGSLLRQNQHGHRSFKTIKTEDHTHYFNAWLDPKAARREGYTNIEYDADGRRRVHIKLGWCGVDSPAQIVEASNGTNTRR